METSVKKSFSVTGLSCASCALSVESMLKSQKGVLNASVNFAASTVLLEYNPSTSDVNDFKQAVQSIGYDMITDEKQSLKLEEVIRNESALLKHKTIWATVFTLPVVIVAM